MRDLEGRVLYWNNAATQLYGWSADQALGKNAHELLKTRYKEPLSALEAKLLAEEHWCGNLIRTTAAGNTLVVDVRCGLRRDVNGNPAFIFETSFDATARERARLRPEDPQRRYHNLFESQAAAFFQVDFTEVAASLRELRHSGVTDLPAHLRERPEFVRGLMRLARVLDVNDRAVALFGSGRKQDLLGPAEVFWPEGSTQVFLESLFYPESGQWDFVRETRLRTLQGTEFDVDFAVHFDAEDRSNLIVTVAAVDITERNRARAASEHAEFMYRNLFHGMAVPFLRLDSTRITQMFEQLHKDGVTDLAAYMDSHPDFVARAKEASLIVEANEPAVRLFGAKTAAELLGPIGRIVLPSKEHVFRATLAAGFAQAPGYQSESKLRRVDGHEIDVMMFVIANPEMRAKGIVMMGLIDLAEQLEARAAIERMRSDLAHASRISMLGELTASIAHEVNQPLTAVTTNAEAGLRWLARDNVDLEEIRMLMRRMVADARRAADVIQRVRGMATRGTSETTAIGINSVIEEASTFLQHEMQARDVGIALDLADNLPDIRADRIQMQQVVVNLMVNAIQAMTSVDARRRRLRIVTSMDDPGHVLVQVVDSGPGIPPDSLPRLFEPFYSTKAGGMGMGLQICQSIVEAHGGRITARNNADVGACFSFTLATAGAA